MGSWSEFKVVCTSQLQFVIKMEEQIEISGEVGWLFVGRRVGVSMFRTEKLLLLI